MSEVIRAAGGVVIRPRPGGGDDDDRIQVLLVHRPDHDDWSLPKGKRDPGESLKHTARREVREETGYRCRLGDKVGTVRYRDGRGRPKRVDYWEMTVRSGSFTPNDEVDEVVWLSPKKACRLLTWDRDVELLRAWLAVR